jgi:predicted aconitase with swiveling domain
MRNIRQIYHAKGPLIKGILAQQTNTAVATGAAVSGELIPLRQMRDE